MCGMRDGWRSMDVIIGFMFGRRGCGTGLPGCGLGCGYDLAYSRV